MYFVLLLTDIHNKFSDVSKLDIGLGDRKLVSDAVCFLQERISAIPRVNPHQPATVRLDPCRWIVELTLE